MTHHSPRPKRVNIIVFASLCASILILCGVSYACLHMNALRGNWLPCKDLTSYSEVEAFVKHPSDLEKELKAVDPSVKLVARKPSAKNCPAGDKGYIAVRYANPFKKGDIDRIVTKGSRSGFMRLELAW